MARSQWLDDAVTWCICQHKPYIDAELPQHNRRVPKGLQRHEPQIYMSCMLYRYIFHVTALSSHHDKALPILSPRAFTECWLILYLYHKGAIAQGWQPALLPHIWQIAVSVAMCSQSGLCFKDGPMVINMVVHKMTKIGLRENHQNCLFSIIHLVVGIVLFQLNSHNQVRFRYTTDRNP